MTPALSALVLFCSSFVVVFSLGFQQQNVTGGHYLAAFLTSFAIGGSYIFLYKLMPSAGMVETVCYLAGGALGIVSSMWIHKRTVGRKRYDYTEAERREINRQGYQPFAPRHNRPADPPPRKP